MMQLGSKNDDTHLDLDELFFVTFVNVLEIMRQILLGRFQVHSLRAHLSSKSSKLMDEVSIKLGKNPCK